MTAMHQLGPSSETFKLTFQAQDVWVDHRMPFVSTTHEGVLTLSKDLETLCPADSVPLKSIPGQIP